jgi:hypothetical protein
MPACAFCQKPLNFEKKPSRREECPHCGRDVCCCLNCRFYDQGAHNQCREPQAEWVSNKEKANFCDFFVLADRESKAAALNEKDRAMTRLEQLFKKTSPT